MKRTIVILLLVVISLAWPFPARACGPYLADVLFVFTRHPDLPLDRFAAGDLGILQPTYARSYLVVAYRYMAGPGFNPAEQDQLVKLWDDRLRFGDPGSQDTQVWLDARKTVAGVSNLEQVDAYKYIDWVAFRNCNADAFVTAAETLKQRIAEFGAGHPAIKAWIQAQDQVFANCSGKPEPPEIPATVPATAPAVFRADRAYQIAAAYFYAGDYQQARSRFLDISKDSSSTWKNRAAYLAVRTLLREATIGTGINNPSNGEILRQAQDQLVKMMAELKNSPDPSLYKDTQRLLAFVRFRTDTVTRAQELAPTLLLKDSQDSLYQDLWDYTAALDKLDSPAVMQDDLTQWLFTFQSDAPESFQTALAKWKATASLPWLVAAIAKVPPAHPEMQRLLDAAQKLKTDSPAYSTVSHHVLRLMIASGRIAAARNILDSLLQDMKATLPPSALNRFLAQRMSLAQNMDEFLTFAQRSPAMVGMDYRGLELLESDDEKPPSAGLIDQDGVELLNTALPLDLLLQASRNKNLSEALRARLTKNVWTRAVLLNRMDIAQQLIPVMKALVPGMDADWEALASTSQAQTARFAAMFLLLKNPGLEPEARSGLDRETPVGEIDNLRDNWWCAQQPQQETSAARLLFLTVDQSRDAATESAALSSLDTAPNLLANETVAWARDHLDDPRVPQALHLAVKATRFGCTNDTTTKYSRAAFQMLHKNFPNNEWTKKTPYYF